MKLIGYLFCVMASMLLGGTIPTGPQPFSLTLEPPTQKLQPGSPVEINLTLTDISGHEIALIDANRWCDYGIEIRDSHGQLPPETGYKRELKCSFRVIAGRRMIRALRPGESFQDEMPVTQIYDLNRADDYYIQVSRKVPKELGGGTIKSNIVTLTISE